jgi:pyruvate dehydrogenase E2 component (dihydrolipoamide acetyltransferase)
MPDFRMPSLGADMDVGRVVAWLVAAGDRVRRGDVIVEVETDKGTFEIESPHDGTVEAIVVPQGTRVPVGTILAAFRSAAGEAPITPAAPPPGEGRVAGGPPETGTPSAEAPRVPGPTPALPQRARVSPLARRIAAERGVDLAQLTGSGAGGAITRADVERAAAGTPRAPAAEAGPEPAAGPDIQAGMRRAIAAAVSRSKREIPHYYLSSEIDLARAMAWLEWENRQRSVEERLLPVALLVKAVATALRRSPALNGFWEEGRFRPGQGIHVGCAISLRDGGLIAPAVHDTDRKSVTELMAALRDLVQRARSGGLRGSEVTDATITVTNLGDQGATAVFGIVYPPQVAIVGFGRIGERPWAEQGMLTVRPAVTVTLAADHRATDGHYGALFLDEVGRLLQTPEAL